MKAPLHILHVFPSFQLGGSQRRFAALVNHFGTRYRHTIISLDGCTAAADLVASHVPHQIFPPREAQGLASFLKAYDSMRAVAPDVLVTYNWGAMDWVTANLLSRIRHIHIEDGFGPEEANRQLPRRVLFRRLILNIQSTLILPSRTLVRLATETWRIAAKRIIYVPNGIACARFQTRVDPETAAGFRGTGPVVGTVATLRKEKALDRLIYAFRDLRHAFPARLVIVGDGPERTALEALVASCELSDCVTFTGELNRPEAVVGAFDVYAISSETEQMPLSVLEAMAAGLPIAATDVGDIRLMVAAPNLPFVVAKDVDALAGALRPLLQDRSLSRSIGDANRDRALSEYDESLMFARYDRIFSGQP